MKLKYDAPKNIRQNYGFLSMTTIKVPKGVNSNIWFDESGNIVPLTYRGSQSTHFNKIKTVKAFRSYIKNHEHQFYNGTVLCLCHKEFAYSHKGNKISLDVNYIIRKGKSL